MTIRVKVVSKNPLDSAQFTLPHHHPDIEFILDKNCESYDWFCVYDDLPPQKDERLPMSSEDLKCPPENTILMTYEPEAVKVYGDGYAKQFSHVLTNHCSPYLIHPQTHTMPPIGLWFYGPVAHAQNQKTPLQKSKDSSVFMSKKRDRHTAHDKRYQFLKSLTDIMPEIDCFGKGYHEVTYKHQGIDIYRYHIAIESHQGQNHWTEKLSDAFLGYALPFYWGCENIFDYFPEDSLVLLDIENPESASEVLKKAIRDHWYQKRLPAISEARRRIIEVYNLPNYIGDVIKANKAGNSNINSMILSRHKFFSRHPLQHLRYRIKKWQLKNNF